MSKLRIGVIGAGPGGYIAALSAARYGAQVILVEREGVGGTCLHHGCIPTKALYRSGQIAKEAESACTFGIHTGEVFCDISEVMRRKKMLIRALSDGVRYLLEAGNVEILCGEAQFIDNHHVKIIGKNSRILEADKFIIATGSKCQKPPFSVEGDSIVLSAEEVMGMERLPERILIVGGGVTGVEMAAIYRTLGVQVTLVECRDRLLAEIEEEVVNYLRRELEKQGVKIYLSSTVEKIVGHAGNSRVWVKNKEGKLEEISVDVVLMAAGRRGTVEKLCLNYVGVQVEDGFIKVNDSFETTVPDIYAIGDVCGQYMLAHVASYQGEVLAKMLVKGEKGNNKLNPEVIPHCVFSLSEIASVGLCEKAALERGIPVAVGRFPFSANGKAFVDGFDGFIKTIVDQETEKILGIHIVGQGASTLIGEATLIVSKHMKVREVAEVIYPHPTLSEALREACLSAVGEAFHVANLSGSSC